MQPEVKKKKLFHELTSTLNSKEIPYYIHILKQKESLEEIASEAVKHHENIISLGGDSTHNIIANQILKQRYNNILAMLPGGFTNDICKALKLNTESVCPAIKSDNKRDMDVGSVVGDGNETSYFIGSAGIGLMAAVNRYIEKYDKKPPHKIPKKNRRFKSNNSIFYEKRSIQRIKTYR